MTTKRKKAGKSKSPTAGLRAATPEAEELTAAPEGAEAAGSAPVEPEAPSESARDRPADVAPTSSLPPLPGDVLVEEPIITERDDDGIDVETTVNLSGDLLPGRDDLDPTTISATGEELAELDGLRAQRKHLRGLLEALVFASDVPIPTRDLARLADNASVKHVRELLEELKQDYATRGFHLAEVANGWVFRTSVQYAPYVRDLTKQKPVKLSRAQVEALAIIAYRQPITRPEIDDVRGVDSGPVLKVLLERDLVRILGKRDEPGRPIIYGTTNAFLEFFGLRSLKDLPTLREFTELTDESKAEYEDEIGESPDGFAGDQDLGDEDALEGRGPSEETAEQDRGAFDGLADDEAERHERVEELIEAIADDDIDAEALEALQQTEVDEFREGESDQEQAWGELERGDDDDDG